MSGTYTKRIDTPEFKQILETIQALRYDMSEICSKVVQLIDSEVWRDYITPDHKVCQFDSFKEFVESPYGLDTTMWHLDCLAMASEYRPLDVRLEQIADDGEAER